MAGSANGNGIIGERNRKYFQDTQNIDIRKLNKDVA